MNNFVELCNNNNISEIKKTINEEYIDLSYNYYEVIKICCKNNYFELFRELYSLIKECNILIPEEYFDEYSDENILCFCSRYNYFYMVEIIFEIDPDYNIGFQNSEAICLTCQEGCFELFKYLINKIEYNEDDVRNFLSSAVNINFVGNYETKYKIVEYLLNQSDNLDNMLEFSYINGCFEMIQLLDLKWLNTNSLNFVSIFKEHCECGNIDILKYLFETKPVINRYLLEPNCDIIDYFGVNGNMNIIKILIEFVPEINISNTNLFFINCCTQNKLELLKWIYEKYPDIGFTSELYDYKDYDYEEYNNNNNQWEQPQNPYTAYMGFEVACNKGYLELGKWLYEIIPDINLEYKDELYFKLACGKGNIDMVNWLYNLNPEYTMTENILITVCDCCNTDMIDWIISKNYKIDIYIKNYKLFYSNIYNIFVRSDQSIKLLQKLFQIHEDNLKSQCDLSHEDKLYSCVFSNYCIGEHGDLLKWLYDKYSDKINLSYDDELSFKNSLRNSKVKLMTWLLKIKPDINIMYDIIDVYSYLTTIEKIDWYIQNYPDFDISYDNELLFRSNISNITILKWLLEKKPDIDISVYDEFCFRISCRSGYMNTAKWLLDKKPDIDISAVDDYAFRKACKYGDIKFINWLLEIKPDIDISACEEYAFRKACVLDRVTIVEHLLYLKPDIDITVNNHIVFKTLCDNYNLYLAEYIASLKPEIYEIISWDDDEIKYKIKQLLKFIGIKYNNDEPEDCCICYDEKCNIITNCGHKYCHNCLSKWINHNINVFCPYCKNTEIELYKLEFKVI